MKISEIYSKYEIPLNLQEHMLRVASVASLICDEWNGKELDRTSIIKTLLLHDMGNIIKFNFEDSEKIMKEQKDDLSHWKNVQKQFIDKYGDDEHIATEEIAKECGVSEYILFLIKNRGSSKLNTVLSSDNWDLKVSSYADFRVDPFGIVSVNQRFDDIEKRYGMSIKNTEKRKRCLDLEEQIKPYIYFDLISLDNQSIKEYFSTLRSYEI